MTEYINYNGLKINTFIIMDYIEYLQNEMINDSIKSLDDIMIKGLKRKGYEFDSRQELEEFIKRYCRCEDYTHLKSKNYFVKDECFLIHDYNIDFKFQSANNDNSIRIVIDQGRFMYP